MGGGTGDRYVYGYDSDAERLVVLDFAGGSITPVEIPGTHVTRKGRGSQSNAEVVALPEAVAITSRGVGDRPSGTVLFDPPG